MFQKLIGDVYFKLQTPEYDVDAECYIRKGKSFFAKSDLYRYLEEIKSRLVNLIKL